MTIQSFAAGHRLKVRLDECGDQVIPGKRGHLYFDDNQLCLMVTDGAPAHQSRWSALGGNLWMGDIGSNGRGHRVQDVKITGIPPENAKAAIRMIRARTKRLLSPEELRTLQARMLNARASLNKPHPLAVESIGEP
jgi:hypothetical protein